MKWSGILRILQKSLHLDCKYKQYFIIIFELQNVEFHCGATYFSDDQKTHPKTAWKTMKIKRNSIKVTVSTHRFIYKHNVCWTWFPNFKMLSFTVVKPTFPMMKKRVRKQHEINENGAEFRQSHPHYAWKCTWNQCLLNVISELQNVKFSLVRT